MMENDKGDIIFNIETVTVFRNGSRRQDPLKLRLSDPVLFVWKKPGSIFTARIIPGIVLQLLLRACLSRYYLISSMLRNNIPRSSALYKSVD